MRSSFLVLVDLSVVNEAVNFYVELEALISWIDLEMLRTHCFFVVPEVNLVVD